MRRVLTEAERAEYVDTREAAALVGLRLSSFYAYVASGNGPPRALKYHGRVYYRRADVEVWRQARSVAPSEPVAAE